MQTPGGSDHGPTEFDLNLVSWDNIYRGRLIAISVPITLVESVLLFPAYVLKTRLQTLRGDVTFKLALQNAREIGLKGLYRGFWTSTIGEFAPSMCYLATYTYTRDNLARLDRQMGWSGAEVGRQAMWVSMLAGAAAETVSCMMSTPVDVVVQRLQIQDRLPENARYAGGFDAFRQIYSRHGIRGLYVGIGVSLCVAVPQSAMWWTLYETAKGVIASTFVRPDKDGVIRLSAPVQASASFLAGVCTAMLSNPLEIVRTRIQTDRKLAHLPPSSSAAVPSSEMYAAAASAHGYGALMKGIGPRLAMSSVISPLFSFIYEGALRLCTKTDPHRPSAGGQPRSGGDSGTTAVA